MPRPKQSRTARLQRKTSPLSQDRQESSSSDLYNHSDREQERLRNQRRPPSQAVASDSHKPKLDDIAKSSGDVPTSDVPRGREAVRLDRNHGGRDASRSGSVLGRVGRGMTTPLHSRDIGGLGLDDDDTTFGDIDRSFDIDSDDDGAVRGRSGANTPAMDTTTRLRRHGPRASSLVGRGDALIRPSSRGLATPSVGTTLKIGAFRRRAREPSILGTTRRRRLDDPGRNSSPGGPESDTSTDDGDITRQATLAQAGPRGVKRKSTGSPPRPARRRSEKSIRLDTDDDDDDDHDDDHDDERDALGGGDEPGHQSRNPMEDAATKETLEFPSSLTSPLSDVPFVVPNRDGATTPEPDNVSVMAPPASSGTDDEDDFWPDLQTLARRRRRLSSVALGIRAGGQSDISSPPSLTHSPIAHPANAKPVGASKGRAAHRHFSPSPKLTSLFSKGRRASHEGHGTDEDDDIDSMTLNPNDDELSYVAARPRRTAGRAAGSKGSSKKRRALGQNKLAGESRKSQETARARLRRISKTYGSRRPSNKENEDTVIGSGDSDVDVDGSFGGNPTTWKEGDELKKAVRKFKEVDQWELNFEEAVGSSSPPDAR